MFDTLLAKVSLAIVTAATAIAGLFGIAKKSDIPVVQPPAIIQNVAGQDQPVGASIPVVVSLFETSLQSRIGVADNSMTLVSGSDRNGTALSGYMCFTIDEGTNNVEYVCGTASGSSITSLARGLDPLTGTTQVTALKKAHNRGATVKVTNFPQLAIVSRILNGQETLPNPVKYDASISTTTVSSNTAFLANVAYVNGVALQGAPTATSTTPGVAQLASGIQLSAGTAMSGSYTLVPQNSFFSSTFRVATTVPVTLATGKLSNTFLDLSSYNGTAGLATTTFSVLPTIPLTPATSTDAASKGYVDSDPGAIYKSGIATYDLSSASGNQTIAHGLGKIPKYIRVTAWFNEANASPLPITSVGTYNGSTIAMVYHGNTGNTQYTAGVSSTYIIAIYIGSSVGNQVATATFDSTNITLSWTKSNSPTGVVQLLWEAYY